MEISQDIHDFVMDVVIGSIRRERERVARRLGAMEVSEAIIAAIVDQSEDMDVFNARGPSAPLPKWD